MTYDTGTTPPLTGTTGTPATSAPPSMGTGTNTGTGTASGKDAAKQGAAEVAGSAKEHAGAVAGTAQEQTQRVAAEAKTQAKDVLGQARTEVNDQARQQQQRAASGLRSLGTELSSMAEQGGQGGMAQDLAHQAAQKASGLADWLENREPGQLLDEARTYARRHPGGFLLGAAVAGVVAGRLTRGLKASHDQQSNGTSGTYPGGYSGAGYAGTSGYDVDLTRPEPLPGPAVTERAMTGTTTGRDAVGERRPTDGPLAEESTIIDPGTTDLRDRAAGGVAGTGTTTGRVIP
ncbi:MAG: hypothetical protein ACTHOD_04665 [Motilibacteraceae bacterium]